MEGCWVQRVAKGRGDRNLGDTLARLSSLGTRVGPKETLALQESDALLKARGTMLILISKISATRESRTSGTFMVGSRVL
jgi:hypothetical protein